MQMSRHPWMLLCLLYSGLFAESRPNIVFILADDLGYGEVGYNGQKIIRTPNVDRLAREGMILTRHYCGNAVCAPSRTVLMTGLNPGHAPVRDNKDVGEGEQTPLPAGITTLPATLKQAGYTTAAFGKWGMGSFDSPGNPLKQGFDHFLGMTSQWVAHSHYPPFIWDDGKHVPLDNGPKGVPGHANFPAGADPKDPAAYAAYIGKDFSSDRTIAGAETFIAQQPKDKPFFLYYASPLPHVSLQVPAEDLKAYDGLITEAAPYTPAKGGYVPNRTPRTTYAAMITRLDKEVGRILAALEKAGVADNTIIVFSGDNGATHDAGGVDTGYFNSAGGLKGLKGSLHEGGVREPTVVRWPAGIKAGTRSNRISGFEDWLFTFSALAGVKMERAAGSGENLLQALKGTDTPRANPLYREFPGYGSQQAIWDGKWKAIRTDMAATVRAKGQIHTQLYDLDADPNEATDLADKFPEVVKELEAKMTAARVPDPNFPLIGVDPAPANAGKGKKKAATK